MLAALLFCAFVANSSKAFAQDDEPVNFPADQQIPKPGPATDLEVTLWQLPENYKSVIKTDSGEMYGIYYSEWARKENPPLPGVFHVHPQASYQRECQSNC